MGVTGKTIQHKFNFYSTLGETFGLRRRVAQDKTATHKSVLSPFGIATVCVLRYCSDSFVQLGNVGHSLEVFEASVPPKSEASDPSAQACHWLEFFLHMKRQIDKGWHQRSYNRSSHLSSNIFCRFPSSSCILSLRRLGLGTRKVLELELQMPLQRKSNRNNSRRHRVIDDV